MHIKSPRSPVLRLRAYRDWENYLYFGNFVLYHTIKYEWAERNYVNSPCGIGPNTHLVKHNNGWKYQAPSHHVIKTSYQFHISYPHNIESILLWMHENWTCCTIITWIKYFILIDHYQWYLIEHSLLWYKILHYHAFLKTHFVWLIALIILYFYVLWKYYHTHEDEGVSGNPMLI